ncbi:AbrB/MazE/SpoVT family DNA-binding domain-containing protein [Bacillus sp. FSL W7-1360]
MKEKNEQGVMAMSTKVQKWGNSLAIRIPSHFADQLALQPGSEVTLTVEEQVLTLKPNKPKPTLQDLLADVTPENRHAEIDFGTEGNEML